MSKIDSNEHQRPAEHNKAGHQPATQKNQAQRTTESRSDRESQVGGGNQSQARRGGKAGGH